MQKENTQQVSPEKERDVPAVSLRSLRAGYGKRVILDGITFDIHQGQIVTILGGSGCGKSTLLKHVIGLYPPLSGDILILGRSIVKAGELEKQDIMRSFGVAYQGGALFRSLTLEENVALPLQEYTDLSPSEIKEKVAEKLRLVHLDGFQNLMPTDLSGGMVKRAAFARAMALDPKILFFDEPSAGLDPITSDSLDELILECREKIGATVVVVTHELSSIFKISDRSIVLDAKIKNVIADGPPVELKENGPESVRLLLNRGHLPEMA